jgi:glycosyltransferase involved in cell wall biosynthesis
MPGGKKFPTEQIIGNPVRPIGSLVIGTEVGRMPAIMTHEHNGFIFPPGDSATLSRRLEQLIENADLTTDMRQTGERDNWARLTRDAAAERCPGGYRALGGVSGWQR